MKCKINFNLKIIKCFINLKIKASDDDDGRSISRYVANINKLVQDKTELFFQNILQHEIFMLTRDYKCKLWRNKLFETSGIKLKFVLETLWQSTATNNKKSSALPVAAGLRPARWGSKRAAITTASESQFRQCKNSAVSTSHPVWYVLRAPNFHLIFFFLKATENHSLLIVL